MQDAFAKYPNLGLFARILLYIEQRVQRQFAADAPLCLQRHLALSPLFMPAIRPFAGFKATIVIANRALDSTGTIIASIMDMPIAESLHPD